MIIAVDIGNSNVVIGVGDDESWKYLWRIPTSTGDNHRIYYDVEIRNLILEYGVQINQVKGVVLSSVVPLLRTSFQEILFSIFDTEVLVLGPDLYEYIDYEVPRPYEIGTDLVANAYAGFRQANGPCIITDFGTALTFTTVDETGYIKGVAIAPGIKTAMKALSSNTAQLPEIPLELPESVLGRHTTHAMQAGILWGYVGISKELIAKIREEVGAHYKAIATGGLSFVMKPLASVFSKIDPELTLNGLRLIWQDAQRKKNK